MTGNRPKRPGSRLLLGIALFAGIFASMYAGVRVADFVSDMLGVASTAVRLGMKVIAAAAALPAGFYLIERAFLERMQRRSNAGVFARRGTTSRKTPSP